MGRGDGKFGGVGGEGVAEVEAVLGGLSNGDTVAAANDDFLPAGAVGKVTVLILKRAGRQGQVGEGFDAQDGHAAGTVGELTFHLANMRRDGLAVLGDGKILNPLQCLTLSLGLDDGCLDWGGLGLVEFPLLKELEGGDLGKVKDVSESGTGGGIQVNPRVMIHAEIAHGMRPQSER